MSEENVGAPDAAPYEERMYQFCADVLEEIGPREPCSEAELQLSNKLADLWEKTGFEVKKERFTCHPHAFLDTIRIGVVCYFIVVALYWVVPILSSLLAGVYMVLVYLEVLNYRLVFDGFFKKADGQNVMATIPPTDTIKKRVIVNAHLDAAYEFTLWYHLKNASVPVMVIGMLGATIPMIGGILATLGLLPNIVALLGYISVGISPIVFANLWFRSNTRVVPGAGDDLAGIGVVVGLGQILSEQKLPLASTEVILLGTAAEEAGLRGAFDYIEKNKEMLESVPTTAIALDGIYDARFLRMVRYETLAWTKHDSSLIKLAKACAKKRNFNISECSIPLGASDGTAFERGGLKTATILCQDTSRLIPNYHTRLDTLDGVYPDALTRSLQVVVDMLREIDSAE